VKKKKLLFQSDFALMKTGFGRNARAVLSYLYKTGKYEILHYCCGMNKDNVMLDKTPWKSVGCIPPAGELRGTKAKDPSIQRDVNYGSLFIDEVVKDFKPDVYIAVQDIWGVDFAVPKQWFSKITSCIWTTLDSLPILPSAVKTAKKVDNYWIWSNFATQELRRLGHEHVKTVRGAVECTYFKRLKNRNELRNKFNLKDNFVIGFVFRNQLRKSVPNLLEGFSLFKLAHPNAKAKLLLHTSFEEGWGIPKLAKEYDIPIEDILTTYVCAKCKHYEVQPYTKNVLDCKKCESEKTVKTVNIGTAATEAQLNEVYNLMDVYCHPFTSGGQEIPIQEAKLTELVTLVTNYSCGVDSCVEEAASLPLEWSEYREQGTEFRKASTKPESILEQLRKVYNMTDEERTKMGKQARKWVLLNFDTPVIGKQICEFVDDAPFVDESVFEEGEEEEINPYIPIDNSIKEDKQWLTEAYHKILSMTHVDEDDDGHKYWMELLESKKNSRQDVESYFRQTAIDNKNKKILRISDDKFSSHLDEDDEGKRIIMVIPKDAGDVYLATSLLPSINRLYPDYNLYFACEDKFKDIILGNPHVHKWVPFCRSMEQGVWLEGNGNHKGWFEVAYVPFLTIQENLSSWLHNDKKDKLDLELCTY
jgi:glycosyltransferase involved in cell wall biosynthesis